MSAEKSKTAELPGRRGWETPKIAHVGDVADIVQGGSGKSSVSPTDPGEPNKVKPPNPEGL
jgi:hypothetical protein